MKRTELRRKTPLRRSTTPMKRTPLRSKPRPKGDQMTGSVHAHILNRDRECIGAILLVFAPDLDIRPHQCRNTFGDPHDSTDILQLTVDHFHHHAGGTKGKRADSDAEHGTAACGWLNVNAMSAAIRQGQRRWIAWHIERGTV